MVLRAENYINLLNSMYIRLCATADAITTPASVLTLEEVASDVTIVVGDVQCHFVSFFRRN